MKVFFNARKLTEAFMMAASVAPSRSNCAILQNVKLTAEGDCATLTATDMEVAIQVKLREGVEVVTPGSVMLPVQKVAAILRENSDETIAIEERDSKTQISASRSKYQLLSEPTDEFPGFEAVVGEAHQSVSSRSLAAMIHRTVFAADDDSSRYTLGGVCIESDDGRLIAVATDGRRLAMFAAPATAVGGHSMPPMKTIVPSRAAKLIEKALHLRGDEMVKFGSTLNDITVETSQCVIYARLIEGRFPNWRKVVPEWKDPSAIRVTNGMFLAAVRQTSIATSSESQGIDMKFSPDGIRMEARTAEVGESSVNLIADCDMADGCHLTMRVDNRYVREFCGVIDPEAVITILLGAENQPMLFDVEDGYQYVIMPMAKE